MTAKEPRKTLGRTGDGNGHCGSAAGTKNRVTRSSDPLSALSAAATTCPSQSTRFSPSVYLDHSRHYCGHGAEYGPCSGFRPPGRHSALASAGDRPCHSLRPLGDSAWFVVGLVRPCDSMTNRKHAGNGNVIPERNSPPCTGPRSAPPLAPAA